MAGWKRRRVRGGGRVGEKLTGAAVCLFHGVSLGFNGYFIYSKIPSGGFVGACAVRRFRAFGICGFRFCFCVALLVMLLAST